MATEQDLVEALRRALDALQDERAGREGYEGGAWEYHGYWLIEKRADAERRLGEVLRDLIAERVREELGVQEGS